MSDLPHLTPSFDTDAERFAAGQRSTWVSVVVNGLLTIAQIVIGLWANAQSLVADGMHSLSDMVSDFFVLYANKQASQPADADHPYGHGRIETVTSFFLGMALLAVGLGFLVSGVLRWQALDSLLPIDPLALWVALFTLVAKEALFRYQLAVAERVNSSMLVANAWHQRADAASSLVVAVGIGGSLAGFAWGDILAAAVVGLMIARMGFGFAWKAIRELIDTGLPQSETEAIRQVLLQTSGVLGLHELRTRRMAGRVLVDAHVQVGARISVSEGHFIAEAARRRVLLAHPDVLDVLVHIDPEEDEVPVSDTPLPDRPTILSVVLPLLADLPPPCRVDLHYLKGGVEVELFYLPSSLPEGLDLDALQTRLAGKVQGVSQLLALRFCVANAPG